ncbi:MAG: hybrid sensor histidine kinase/response regulator [Lutibacter sp.]
MNIFKKEFILIFSLSSLISIILLGIYFHSKFETRKNSIIKSESHLVNLQHAVVNEKLTSIINDLRLLAEHIRLSQILESDISNKNGSMQRLTLEFKTFSKGRGYDQIRYIDPNGKEHIRINLKSGKARIADDDSLQNKKNRYYFKNTIKLDSGQIYISPMDLNIEYGKIELPIKPMIRLGTLIFDKNGEKRGVLIINFRAKTLLDAFEKNTILSNGQNIFLNEEGYVLRGNYYNNEWAFMYPEKLDQTFGKLFPFEWKKISENENGQFQSANGLFTFATAHPLATNIVSNSVLNPDLLQTNQYNWKLVSYVSLEKNRSLEWPIWIDFLELTSIILILIFILSWFLAVSKINNKKAKKNLEESHNNLESKVYERTKELLIMKNKAEESDRLKSAFIANMSHEIRTPMNGILGFTGLLKSADLNSDKQQKYIKIIEKSGERLLTTIDDIMNISKIESGLMKIFLSEININNEIEELYEFFKLETENKGLQLLFVNAIPEDEFIIKTDEEKLHSILVNLIKNAIKYTKQGSVEFGCSKKGNQLEFYVKDTGIGIPKDRQSYVFDRFVQADIEDKAVYEGSGLGLAISKSYIEMLGGTIELESVEGIGSTFRFTIPCQAINKEIPVAKNELSNDFVVSEIPSLKILIVEDDMIAKLYLEELLTNVSKEILIADNGYKALELCRKNSDIDLILMDIRMPEINGYEVTKQIRQFNKEVIIIAQTAFAFSGDREKALEAGCNDYISKPINKNELVSLIQKYFKK